MLHFEAPLMPRLYHIRTLNTPPRLADIAQAVREGMAPHMGRIRPGDKIGVCVGSRGLHRHAVIVKAVVDQVLLAGGLPHIIPAMGSHGGATAQGQMDVLASYGITEAAMGAPILSSMETEMLGTMDGDVPVYADRNALSMDGLILINRIKPHTDFHGEYESGLCKMLAIGLGKQKGAETIHRRGVGGLIRLIPQAARVMLEKLPVLMGVASLENALEQTARIEVLPGEDILSREPALLHEARALMPRLPVENLDVLVLREMGKNISGTCIDPNIVGRSMIRGVPDGLPAIYRIVCLDLTDESHGNALGVGMADFITQRLYDKIDLPATYTNVLTSGFVERGFIPLIAPTDLDAIELALNCCGRHVTPETVRMMIAPSTLHIDRLLASEALLEELRARGDVAVEGEAAVSFDEAGALTGIK